jgi:amino acid adenylation domain-containing protein
MNNLSIAPEPIVETAPADVYVLPATPGQARFWGLDQLHPGNPALNMPLAWRCKGALNVAALERALDYLVVRHEVLRTTFDFENGQVVQVIRAPYHVALPVIDLRHIAEPDLDGEVSRLINLEARISLNLQRGPLFVAKLLKLSDVHHIVLVTLHHVICDGWSNGVALRDLAASYDAFLQQIEPDLPALPIQFGDYAIWQKDWLNSEAAQVSLEHWRKALGENLPELQLPQDGESRRTEPVGGDIETLLISGDLNTAARAFCAKHDVTLYMLLLGVFAAVIRYNSGQDDFLIGSPCANRPPDTEDLIGLFANPQIFRCRVNGEDTFLELLSKVRSWTLDAYEHRELPFEQLHEKLTSNGHAQNLRLQVYFLYQKAFMQPQRLSSLEITPIRSVSPGSMFEIMLGVVERAEGPRLQLEYNPNLFRQTTIKRFLDHFVSALSWGISRPDARLEELDLVGGEERELVLRRWNNTAVQFPEVGCVHDLIDRQAKQTPDLVAVLCGGQSWTYQELAERSNRLARYLIKHGIVDGSLVGLYMQRSANVLVAMLGIMKAGAAYLPLDPKQPAERTRNSLTNSGAALVLTEKLLASGLGTHLPVIVLDRVDQDLARESGAPLQSNSGPTSIAYVIYTSGSTGTPKGIAIEHGGLTNLLLSIQREPGLSQQDVMAAVGTFAFDISVLELFLPLTVGASVVIAQEKELTDGSQLLGLLRRSGVTTLLATPITWRVLIDAGWNGQPKLRMFCGGDRLPRDLANELLDRGDELWNMYGPTETTVCSSANRVRSQTEPIRIGSPIANTQFYILDSRMHPVSVGVSGELYIGGRGLARGYWNNPALTAERFVPNPFGEGRLYRTGDLGRWSENGLIDFLGRADHQVKIRGHRIELEEIENALNTHPEVRESVVIAVHQSSGTSRLTAFVEPSGRTKDREQLAASLRTELSRTLPDYMVPQTILILDSLPRTLSGKIDRLNLPLSAVQEVKVTEYVAPRDRVERDLATIWESAFGIRNIGIRTNFFDLGGDSLLILRLIPRVNNAFQSLLPVPSIYAAPTIEQMAALIRSSANLSYPVILSLQPAGKNPPLFMIQSYHLYRELPAAMGGDQPFHGLIEPELTERTYPYGLDELVSIYIKNIRTVQPHGPYYISGFCFSSFIAFEVARQLEASGQVVAFLALIESTCPSRWVAITGGKASATGWRIQKKEELRCFIRQFRSLSLFDMVGRFFRLAGNKISNLLTNLWIDFQIDLFRRYLRRGAKIPRFLRDKETATRVGIREYQPRRCHCDIDLFQAVNQPLAADRDSSFGWGTMTEGTVTTTWIPGTHDDLFLGRNLERLAGELRRAIDLRRETSTNQLEATPSQSA